MTGSCINIHDFCLARQPFFYTRAIIDTFFSLPYSSFSAIHTATELKLVWLSGGMKREASVSSSFAAIGK